MYLYNSLKRLAILAVGYVFLCIEANITDMKYAGVDSSIPTFEEEKYRQIDSVRNEILTRPIKLREGRHGGWTLAFDKDTGVVRIGKSDSDALFELGKSVVIYMRDNEKRTGNIISTEDTLGGKPRVAGTRIGVNHIYSQYQNSEIKTLANIAASFSGILTVDEVRAALEWIEENEEEFKSILKDEELFVEWMEKYRLEESGVDGIGKVKDEEPEVSFEEFKERKR